MSRRAKIGPVRLELEVARAARERGLAARLRFPVTGTSMAPALMAGMRVTVETARVESLRPGDLVCCCRLGPAGPLKFVHRLVRVTRGRGGGRELVTRGDANPNVDPPVGAEDLIGRVVAVEPPPLRFRLRRAAGGLKRAGLRAGKALVSVARGVTRRAIRPS
ncbi:MAG: S24/S26 family peptidase [Planctomycetota bacterium]|jgi:signal peptidase I